MGLKDNIVQAVDHLFATLSEFVTTATLTKETTDSFNAATGKPTSTTTTYSIQGIAYNDTATSHDDKPQAKWAKVFTFKQSELTASAPTTFDKLTVNGVKHEITDVEQDPAAITWTLTLRVA